MYNDFVALGEMWRKKRKEQENWTEEQLKEYWTIKNPVYNDDRWK